jgi:acetyl-CoA carboxylase biotin carboxyl carrier protein
MSKKKASPNRVASSAKSAAEGPVASKPDPVLKRVRDLARIANEFDLEEIEVSGDGSIRLSRGSASVAQLAPIHSIPRSAPTMSLVPPPPVEAVDLGATDGTIVMSPFVGTFYRAPSPEHDPFVEVGQMIRKGQVVCIVEAMKLMNEIEADADGKLLEILVKNGEHVEYGQALLRLAKT